MSPTLLHLLYNLSPVALIGVAVLVFLRARQTPLWGEAFRRLARNPSARAAMAVIAIYATIGIADSIGWYDSATQERRTVIDAIFERKPERTYSAPLAEMTTGEAKPQKIREKHILGTDSIGADVFYRTLKGVRTAFQIGGMTVLIVTPLGIALAVGSHRMRGKLSSGVQGLTSIPLITPEIVVGAALLLTITRLFSGIPLGFPAQLLGNITFSISAVVVIVRARLVSIGSGFEEAARDLGATRLQALRFVLMPMLWPSVMASLVVVFATVIDDFVITSFLSAGVDSETVPLRIYSSVRGGATPALNALATLLVATTFAALTIALFALSQWRKRHGEPGGIRAALADITRMGE